MITPRLEVRDDRYRNTAAIPNATGVCANASSFIGHGRIAPSVNRSIKMPMQIAHATVLHRAPRVMCVACRFGARLRKRSGGAATLGAGYRFSPRPCDFARAHDFCHDAINALPR